MIIIKNKLTKELFTFYNKFQLAFHLIGAGAIPKSSDHNHLFFAKISVNKILALANNQDWVLVAKEEEPVDFYSEAEIKENATA